MEIVLLVTGAILLGRLTAWLGAKITDRIDANARETDALVRSEAAKHRNALAQVITWAVLVVIYCVTGLALRMESLIGKPLAIIPDARYNLSWLTILGLSASATR